MKSAPSAIYNHGMGKDSQRFFKDLDKKDQPWESVVIGRALRDNNNRSIGPLRVPKHKGSRYRFLTWVAFFRGNSPTLSDELKRSCPIVECPRAQKPFDNMNDMLQHVYTCDHLSKGYSKGHYLCPECNQEERISRCHIRGCNNTSSCTNQLVRSTKQLWQSVSGSLRRRSADSIKLSSNYRFAELPAVIPAELQDPQSSLPFELGANASDNFRTNRSELADSSSGWPGHGVLERSQTYPPPNNPYLSKSQSSQQETANRSPPPSYAYQNMQDWVAQTPNVGALPHVDDSSHKHYLLQNMYGLEAYVNSNFPAHRPSPLTSPAPEAGQYYTPSPIESHTSSGVESMMQSPTNISSITSPSEGYLSNLGSGDITGYSTEHSMSQLQNGPRELFSPRESYPNESPIVANYWPAQNAMYNQNFAMPQGSKFFSPEHVGQQFGQQTPNSLIAPTQYPSSISEEQAQSPNSPTTCHELPAPSPKQQQCICGYVPRGKDIHKASNLKRHQSTCRNSRRQAPYDLSRRDSNLVKPHKCHYNGCGRSYTRSDNLKVHQKNKNHFHLAELECDFSLAVMTGANNQQSAQRPPFGTTQRAFSEENAWH